MTENCVPVTFKPPRHPKLFWSKKIANRSTRFVPELDFGSSGQADGRDSPVTGSPACYLLEVLGELRVLRGKKIARLLRLLLAAELGRACVSAQGKLRGWQPNAQVGH